MIGGLLGTQNGREVEIVNSFELAMDDEEASKVDHGFLTSRKEQCEILDSFVRQISLTERR